jgi:hypothetical protein
MLDTSNMKALCCIETSANTSPTTASHLRGPETPSTSLYLRYGKIRDNVIDRAEKIMERATK